MGVTAMVRTKVSVMVATTMIRATRFLLHPHRRQHQRPRPPLRLPLLPPLGMVAAETATAMATNQSVRPRLRPLRPWLRYLRHHPQLVFQECRIVFRLAPLPMRMMTRGAMLQWNALL